MYIRSSQNDALLQNCFFHNKLPGVFQLKITVGKILSCQVFKSDDNTTATNLSTPSTCVREEYTGSTCRSYLASFQSCIDGNNASTRVSTRDDPIYIVSQQDQAAQEELINSLMLAASLFITVSEECMMRLKPFACLHLFPLISCENETENGTIYRPTASQCMSLRDDVCRDLWSLAAEFQGDRGDLPDCNDKEEQPPLDLLEDCQGEEDLNECELSVLMPHWIHSMPVHHPVS